MMHYILYWILILCVSHTVTCFLVVNPPRNTFITNVTVENFYYRDTSVHSLYLKYDASALVMSHTGYNVSLSSSSASFKVTCLVHVPAGYQFIIRSSRSYGFMHLDNTSSVKKSTSVMLNRKDPKISFNKKMDGPRNVDEFTFYDNAQGTGFPWSLCGQSTLVDIRQHLRLEYKRNTPKSTIYGHEADVYELVWKQCAL